MAVDQFKRALDIDPRHEGSRNNLSRARQAFLQGRAARKKKTAPKGGSLIYFYPSVGYLFSLRRRCSTKPTNPMAAMPNNPIVAGSGTNRTCPRISPPLEVEV